MGMDGRRTSLTAPKNRIHRLWHSGLLLQQRWQHVGAEGEQAMQGDGGLGRCWVCGCGVDSALPAGRTVASTRSTEGERALRTRRGGAMLAAKQQIYLGGNYQPGPYRIPRRAVDPYSCLMRVPPPRGAEVIYM